MSGSLCLSEGKVTPKPLLVLVTGYNTSYQPMIQTPKFVLYENGEALFWKEDGYRSASLSPEEVKQLMASLPLGDFFKLKDSYPPKPGFIEHPHFIHLMVWKDGKFKKVGYVGFPPNENQDKSPKAFWELYEKITAFSPAEAKPWDSGDFDVYLRPRENVDEVVVHSNGKAEEYRKTPVKKSIPWPKDWPGLESAVLHDKKESPAEIYMDYPFYTIRLKNSVLSQFLPLSNEEDKFGTPYAIGGKYFRSARNISYRFVIPNEEMWLKPLVGQ